MRVQTIPVKVFGRSPTREREATTATRRPVAQSRAFALLGGGMTIIAKPPPVVTPRLSPGLRLRLADGQAKDARR